MLWWKANSYHSKGDFIVVVPSQTPSSEEYHMLRETTLELLRHLGIIKECDIRPPRTCPLESTISLR